MFALWSFKKLKRRRMDQKQVAVGYDNLQKHGSSNEYYRNTVKNLRSVSGKILDIGCGYGDLLLEFERQNKNIDLYGTDISKKAVDYCKKLGINADIGNADSMPYPDKTFDLVVMSLVIEHVIDQEKALNEVYRILKDNGRFLLTTDNVWWLVMMQIKNIVFPWKPKYRRFQQPINDEFTYGRLRRLLESCNLKIVQRERSGPIAIADKYLREFKWTIMLHKRHWIVCAKILAHEKLIGANE